MPRFAPLLTLVALQLGCGGGTTSTESPVPAVSGGLEAAPPGGAGERMPEVNEAPTHHRHTSVDLSGLRLVDDPTQLGEDPPFQRFLELPGRVVGLIWLAGPQPWGGSLGHTLQIENDPSRVEYKFGVDGSSPYAVYFHSDGRGYNFLRNWSVPTPDGGDTRFGAAMFTATTPNEWGLHARAHLVEVEVNGGRGGAGIHFVVTDARVLDGTASFPWSAEDQLVAMRAIVDAALDANDDDALARIARRLEDRAREYTFTGRTTDEIAIWPTWRRDAARLEVRFQLRHQVVGRGPVVSRMRPCPVCPPGAPCVRCDPHPIEERPTLTVGYVAGARFVVDQSGAMVDRVFLRPQVFESRQDVPSRPYDRDY